jgi:hypothetical protein
MNRKLLSLLLLILFIAALFVALANPGAPGRAPRNQRSTAPAARATSTAAQTTPTAGPGEGLNGVPIDEIIVLPPEVVTKMREVYQIGQVLGNNPRAFS